MRDLKLVIKQNLNWKTDKSRREKKKGKRATNNNKVL